MSDDEEYEDVIITDDTNVGDEDNGVAGANQVANTFSNTLNATAGPPSVPQHQHFQPQHQNQQMQMQPFQTIQQPVHPDDGHQYVLRRPAMGRPTEKGAGQRMMYETGVSYIAGVGLGTGYGVWAGFQKKLTGASSPKIRLNAILNQSAKYSTSTANTFGSFALFYSGMRSYVRYRRNNKTDIWNDIAGVTFAGCCVNLPKGILPSLTMGAMLGAGASVYFFANHRYKTWKQSQLSDLPAGSSKTSNRASQTLPGPYSPIAGQLQQSPPHK
jgi:hypothetical protein